MSLKIVIPGADFSAIGNPKVKSLLYGFPVEGLAALYLMEDGAVGSVPTQISDSSGKGNHAVLRTGSTIIKTAEGVRSDVTAGTATLGWTAKTPVSVTESFTRLTVTRDRAAPVINEFTMPFGFTAAEVPNMGSTQWAAGGATQIHDLNTGTSNATIRRPQGYAVKGGGTNKWDALPAATFNLPGNANSPVYEVHGFSYNKASGRLVIMGNGGTFDFLGGQDAVDWFAAQAPFKHAIGHTYYGGAQTRVMGDTALCALYSGLAMEPADLLSLMSAARARVATRGVTAV